jgi:hypothetical protein
VSADDDPRAAAGQRADDISEPRLTRQPLEPAVREQRAQRLGQAPQLRGAGGALAVRDLALDQLPGPLRVETIDRQMGRPGRRTTHVAGAPQRERAQDGRAGKQWPEALHGLESDHPVAGGAAAAGGAPALGAAAPGAPLSAG